MSSIEKSSTRPASISLHTANASDGDETLPESIPVRLRNRTDRVSKPAKLLGSWQLNQLLAQGTLTVVYDARPMGCPPSRPSDYAVKVLKSEFLDDPVARAALERETEVGRHCSHANLVPILEAHLDHEFPHLVMPRIEGACLATVIEHVGNVVIPQALWITRQVAQALHHLHHQGWVHGDIKPANMMVSRQGHATLIDLAFAMRPDESIYSSERSLQGTLAYVAPELLTSTNATHPASDMYSLGVTLYEMLAGRLPFATDNPKQLVESHLRVTPPDFEPRLRVPASVQQLVKSMLAKSPIRRPQSAAELIDALLSLEIETLETRFAS